MTFTITTTGDGRVQIHKEREDIDGQQRETILAFTPADADAIAMQLPKFAVIARREEK